MSPPVLTDRSGAVTTLTLNRPDRLNAFSGDLVEALLAALDMAAENGTRLVVFRATGKGFSGGFDLSDLERETDASLLHRFVRVEQLLQAVHHAPFSTMALVHGPCYGAAADLVSSCLHRIATPTARFRMPGLRFGIVLGTRRLTELVGKNTARRLLESSATFDTREALECGFLGAIADETDWPAFIDKAAASAASLTAHAHRELLERTLEDHRDTDLAALVRSAATPGLKQRISDFLASLPQKPR